MCRSFPSYQPRMIQSETPSGITRIGDCTQGICPILRDWIGTWGVSRNWHKMVVFPIAGWFIMKKTSHRNGWLDGASPISGNHHIFWLDGLETGSTGWGLLTFLSGILNELDDDLLEDGDIRPWAVWAIMFDTSDMKYEIVITIQYEIIHGSCSLYMVSQIYTCIRYYYTRWRYIFSRGASITSKCWCQWHSFSQGPTLCEIIAFSKN